jgi:hypothetical protein
MTSRALWRVYERDDVLKLPQAVRQPGPEWICPACKQQKLRMYRYRSESLGEPTLVTYVWCAHCYRFHGETGRAAAGLTLQDPLSPEDRQRREPDQRAWFDYLDSLWESGVLPQ